MMVNFQLFFNFFTLIKSVILKDAVYNLHLHLIQFILFSFQYNHSMQLILSSFLAHLPCFYYSHSQSFRTQKSSSFL